MIEAIIAVVALIAGLVGGWLLGNRPVAALTAERDEARREADERRTRIAETAVEIAALQAQRDEREQSHARQLEELNTRFEALAGRVLEQAQSQLITRAEQRFAPSPKRLPNMKPGWVKWRRCAPKAMARSPRRWNR